jgi:hypothetical protein
VLYFAVTLRMVGSSKTGLNTKMLVKSSYKMGGKLRATIGEDLLRDSMKMEYVGVVDISGTFGCKVRLAGYKVALIRIVVDVDADRVEAI